MSSSVYAGRGTPMRGPVATESRSMIRRLLDVVAGERMANFAVAAALVIGFFHGWLKLRIRHPISTFLFDIPVIFAMLITFFRLGSWRDWFPPSHASRALMAFYGVVGVWFLLAMVLPWGAPLLPAVAALRGWAFATLTFGLGYHIIQSRRQLHGYFILVILLAAVTAAYSTRQTLEEVEAMRAMDPYFELMTRGQGYVDDEGRLVLRRFSTFVSSGAFGGAMALSLLFLAALVTDRTVGRGEKAILIALALLIAWGMSLSGSRSSLIALILGLMLVIWFRRLSAPIWILGGVFAVALYLAVRSTDGGAWDRFSNLELETIWGRFYIVWAPGVRFLLKSAFLGGGLGKAAVGLPGSLLSYFPQYEVWGVDGDLGKTMAELGIVGVVVVGWLLLAALRDGFEVLKRRRDDAIGTLTLGAVACFSIAVVTFPIGSPFIGIPLGVLTWFFLGAAIKLDHIESAAARATPGRAAGTRAEPPGLPPPRDAGSGRARRGAGDARKPGDAPEPGHPGPSAGGQAAEQPKEPPPAPPGKPPAPPPRKKVFLYHQPSEDEGGHGDEPDKPGKRFLFR